MSASVQPSAISPMTNSTDRRVPRTMGLPARIAGSSVIRSSVVIAIAPRLQLKPIFDAGELCWKNFGELVSHAFAHFNRHFQQRNDFFASSRVRAAVRIEELKQAGGGLFDSILVATGHRASKEKLKT